jgi:hypothetical protein
LDPYRILGVRSKEVIFVPVVVDKVILRPRFLAAPLQFT